MPWTPKEFKEKHNHGLSSNEASVAAHAANQALAHGHSEKDAVIAGNVAAKNARQAGSHHHYPDKKGSK